MNALPWRYTSFPPKTSLILSDESSILQLKFGKHWGYSFPAKHLRSLLLIPADTKLMFDALKFDRWLGSRIRERYVSIVYLHYINIKWWRIYTQGGKFVGLKAGETGSRIPVLSEKFPAIWSKQPSGKITANYKKWTSRWSKHRKFVNDFYDIKHKREYIFPKNSQGSEFENHEWNSTTTTENEESSPYSKTRRESTDQLSEFLQSSSSYWTDKCVAYFSEYLTRSKIRPRQNKRSEEKFITEKTLRQRTVSFIEN